MNSRGDSRKIVEVDLCPFLHDCRRGFHHSLHDVLLPAQEQGG